MADPRPKPEPAQTPDAAPQSEGPRMGKPRRSGANLRKPVPLKSRFAEAAPLEGLGEARSPSPRRPVPLLASLRPRLAPLRNDSISPRPIGSPVLRRGRPWKTLEGPTIEPRPRRGNASKTRNPIEAHRLEAASMIGGSPRSGSIEGRFPSKPVPVRMPPPKPVAAKVRGGAIEATSRSRFP